MKPHAKLNAAIALSLIAALAAHPALGQQKTVEQLRAEAEAFEAEAARLLGETPAKPAPRPAPQVQAPAPRPVAAAPAAPPPPVAQAGGLPVCKAGMRVPIISPLNYGGTILAVDPAKGSYRVKNDDGLIDWVDARSLRFSCVGLTAPAITSDFFIGNWEMFIGPTPNNVVINGKAYVEVGPGAKAPPIVVRADGTYSWRIDSKTTVAGRWRPMVQAEMKYGTKVPAILLMKGEDGKDWEMYRRGTALADNRDQATIERMDLGLSYMATRSK